MAGLKEIAKKAGVSRGTVDRALHNRGRVSPETKEKILQIAKELNYQPNIAAKSLAARKLNLKLGFLYVDNPDAPFQKSIAEAARGYAGELTTYGVEVIFIPMKGDRPINDSETRLWRLIRDYELDGIAMIGPVAQDVMSALQSHGRSQIPFVLYNIDASCEWSRSYVGCDLELVGKMACGMAALMTHNEGKIYTISMDYTNLRSSWQRIKGFIDELSHYPKMSIVARSESNHAFDTEQFRIFLKEIDHTLRSRPEIDVIYLDYAGGNRQTIRIAKLAERYGVRIITGDLVTEEQKDLLRRNLIAAEISQDAAEQGRKALELLFRITALSERNIPDHCLTKLVINIPQSLPAFTIQTENATISEE